VLAPPRDEAALLAALEAAPFGFADAEPLELAIEGRLGKASVGAG